MKKLKIKEICCFIISTLLISNVIIAQSETHIRARDLGISFDGIPGKFNSITDIKGVEVGYTTIIEGSGKLIVGKGPIRTGVTTILPKGKSLESYPMGSFVFNGNGESTGLAWLQDYGSNQGPIGITNTYSVGVVRDAIGEWCYNKFSNGGDHDFSFGLPVVSETYDGGLNDINGLHIKKEHVFKALESAHSGYIKEGNVGGGTGMVCYWFKGGTGTSSRIIKVKDKSYTVGVLVQANFGFRKDLIIRGVPYRKILADTLMPEVRQDGSIIIVVGTDAPLSGSQLNLVAKRAALGFARTGTYGSMGSGDIFFAFSTNNNESESNSEEKTITILNGKSLNPIFRAAVDATEEAIINAMVAAETMEGINGNKFHAIPHEIIKYSNKEYNELIKCLQAEIKD